MAGKFIAFEGGEGTGKSTQARLLAEYLKVAGLDTVLTREPGGTEGAEAIRALLLDPAGKGWGARAEALLFAAARADHVEKLIKPAIAAGKWVVCDRFLDSSRAYQGGAGGIGNEAVLALHDVGSGGLKPDLTLLVTIPPQVAEKRLSLRDGDQSDAIGGRGAEYHRAVAESFAAMAKQEPGRFAVIDGDGAIEVVQSRVIAAATQHFGLSL